MPPPLSVPKNLRDYATTRSAPQEIKESGPLDRERTAEKPKPENIVNRDERGCADGRFLCPCPAQRSACRVQWCPPRFRCATSTRSTLRPGKPPAFRWLRLPRAARPDGSSPCRRAAPRRSCYGWRAASHAPPMRTPSCHRADETFVGA